MILCNFTIINQYFITNLVNLRFYNLSVDLTSQWSILITTVFKYQNNNSPIQLPLFEYPTYAFVSYKLKLICETP